MKRIHQALGLFAKTGHLVPGAERFGKGAAKLLPIAFLGAALSCATVKPPAVEVATCTVEDIASALPRTIQCLATEGYRPCLLELGKDVGRAAVVCAARVVARGGTTPPDAALERAPRATARALRASWGDRQARAYLWLQGQGVEP